MKELSDTLANIMITIIIIYLHIFVSTSNMLLLFTN